MVGPTAKGRRLVGKLSHSMEARYAFMECSLGKSKLAQLYALLDEVIELDGPTTQHSDNFEQPELAVVP